MTLAPTISIPDDAGEIVRHRLRLGADVQPRISYVVGPGDVAGSYAHWQAQEHDPRVPIIAYSIQFFDLIERLDAHAQLLTIHDSPAPESTRFTFDAVRVPPWQTRSEFFASQEQYARDVIAKIETYDPHIILATTDFLPYAKRALGNGKRRFVVTAHNTFWPMGQRPSTLKGYIKYLQLKWQARVIDDAVCTSDECARQIAQVTNGRVQGLSQYPQIVEKYSQKQLSKARHLLFLGRIEEAKGIYMLLDAFKTLHRETTDMTLTFAGGGAAADDLKQAIDTYGSDNVRYAGRLGSQGVHEAIEAADLVVCPTTSRFNEGLAVVGFEAAAHGVPTLMSSVVPALDLLGEGCAVFEADNLTSLTAELEALVQDNAHYIALGAKLSTARAALYDRKRSWGSQLFQIFARL